MAGPEFQGSFRMMLDPTDAVGQTIVSNAILYGTFLVKGKPLSDGARRTYLILRSLDWTGKGQTWYTWRKFAMLAGCSMRTIGRHLADLLEAGLIVPLDRKPDQYGGTVYMFAPIPEQEIWRVLHLKQVVTGVGFDLPLLPGADREQFDQAFATWWKTRSEARRNQR